VIIDRALGGHSNLVLGPVLPFLLLGSQTPILERGPCLFLLVLLTAAGVGIWRGERWALTLEVGLLAAGGACLFASAVMLLLRSPAISILHLMLAVAVLAVAWHLAPARRFAIIASVVVCTLLVFGAAVFVALRSLAGLAH
jgi:hypothetical protein